PKIRERPRFSINRRYISANGGGCGKSAATFPRTAVKSGKRRRFWRNAARSRKFRARSRNFACVPAYPRVFREIRAAPAPLRCFQAVALARGASQPRVRAHQTAGGRDEAVSLGKYGSFAGVGV